MWQWGLRQWGREILRWPDPDVAWAKRAARSAFETGFKPDLILVSCPPESLLLAGLRLKKKWACPLWADFRDAWLEPPRRMERRLWFRRLGESMQGRYLLNQCDALSAVDPTVSRDIETINKSAGLENKVAIIPQLVPAPRPSQPIEPTDEIHLCYTGQFSIGDANRSIDTILDCYQKARSLNPRLRLHIAGHLTALEHEKIRTPDMEPYITYHGALSLDATLELQSGADGLILLSSENGWAIPGKLFEYRAQCVPILAHGSGPWRKAAGLSQNDAQPSDWAEVKKRTIDKNFTPIGLDNPGEDAFIAIFDYLMRS
jgi:glycosyltransferase involved in cell wall biosynthesis